MSWRNQYASNWTPDKRGRDWGSEADALLSYSDLMFSNDDDENKQKREIERR